MTASTTTRAARVAEGRCAVCLRRRRTAPHPTCAPCRARIAEHSASLYATRRAAGLCVRCAQPADGYLCEHHAEQRRRRRTS